MNRPDALAFVAPHRTDGGRWQCRAWWFTCLACGAISSCRTSLHVAADDARLHLLFCHPDRVAAWKHTAHATAHRRSHEA